MGTFVKFWLTHLKLLINFENLLLSCLKDHTATILRHWKCIQEAACDSVKSYWKSPVTSWFLRISPAVNESQQKLILSPFDMHWRALFFHASGWGPQADRLISPDGPAATTQLCPGPPPSQPPWCSPRPRQAGIQGCSRSALFWPIDVSSRLRQAGTRLQPLSSSLANWCFNYTSPSRYNAAATQLFSGPVMFHLDLAKQVQCCSHSTPLSFPFWTATQHFPGSSSPPPPRHSPWTSLWRNNAEAT